MTRLQKLEAKRIELEDDIVKRGQRYGADGATKVTLCVGFRAGFNALLPTWLGMYKALEEYRFIEARRALALPELKGTWQTATEVLCLADDFIETLK